MVFLHGNISLPKKISTFDHHVSPSQVTRLTQRTSGPSKGNPNGQKGWSIHNQRADPDMAHSQSSRSPDTKISEADISFTGCPSFIISEAENPKNLQSQALYCVHFQRCESRDIEISSMAIAVLGFSCRSYLTFRRPLVYCVHKVSHLLEKNPSIS